MSVVLTSSTLTTPNGVGSPMVPATIDGLKLRRFTRPEYHHMGTLGLIPVDTQPGGVELLDGYIVEKPVKNPPHSTSLRRMTAKLPGLLSPHACYQSQDPIELDLMNEPEPDGVILRGGVEQYDHRNPTAADIAVVIEVSDSSLSKDRRKRAEIYARNRIPIYWILNVVDRQVEVHERPSDAGYEARTVLSNDDLVPIIVDGVAIGSIAVQDLIPVK